MPLKAIPDKNFFRPDEVAKFIDESTGNVYRWIRLGMIRHVPFGKKVKVPRSEVERILAQGVQKPSKR